MFKTKPTLSFEERLAGAAATAEAAVSVVENIASDLESAAADKRQLAKDITAEIERIDALAVRLLDLRDEALHAAEDTEAKAVNFRSLLSA